MKKFRFSGKMLHSKGLRMINGGSGITECNQQELFGTEIAAGSNLEGSVGPGPGRCVDPGKGWGRGVSVSEESRAGTGWRGGGPTEVTVENVPRCMDEAGARGAGVMVKAGPGCAPVLLDCT